MNHVSRRFYGRVMFIEVFSSPTINIVRSTMLHVVVNRRADQIKKFLPLLSDSKYPVTSFGH